jgi:acyl transferase domain-containing protein/NADPH:quinone reductase-like Zn-dependent oxidoreductase/NAD(P)-dependent dehydrogenase (short-subunit alcohol dehydrogenase family)/acyl carrier protein
LTGIQENTEQGLSPLKRALIAVKDMRERVEIAERAQREPVAIVGMACRLPGNANTLDDYWRILADGVDAIGEVPKERWDIDDYYDPDPEAVGKMYVREGGFINGADQFDPDFFGITPREATRMDPQQRLLLEVSWKALEHAGIDPQSLQNSLTGVFIGISTSEYAQMELRQGGADRIDAYTGTGGALSVAAGRLSFFLRLRGPAVALDTACSSSSVAIDLAVQYLRSRKCRFALAGGVNLMLSPESTVYLSKVRALSPQGRCKTFDASADGYARGEGCGVIVLKRLHDALEDNDRILAVIRGSAVNHDGHSSGLTVPNGVAQQAVIRAALADADLEPDQISFIEAHGTGTELGDPIEIRALSSVFKQNKELLVGTAKTNIGHLESAAGIAAVIKVVLAFQHNLIPPNLHFNQPSAHIAWDGIPIRIPTEPTPWPSDIEQPIAGVSSFGFSGTNAHLILQAPPPKNPEEVVTDRPLHLMAISAHSEEALVQLAGRYAAQLKDNPRQAITDACYTSLVGRSHFQKRLALVADTREAFVERLEAVGRGDDLPDIVRGVPKSEDRGANKIVFLFTGQGSQYPGMGRLLYDTQPVFRQVLETCDEVLRSHWKRSLIGIIYPEPGEEDQSLRRLNQTAITQPALFAIEYALAQLWRSWGIEPAMVMGHSVGEYVAACVAGVFSLEDGLKLIAERSRLMQALPSGGRMAAVLADAAYVEKIIADHTDTVAIAAMNGPRNTVISGDGEAIGALLQRMAADEVKALDLNVSHAFHSPLMAPMLADFEESAAEISYSAPKVKLISNLTGKAVQGEEIAKPDWWCRHVREPVLFQSSMQALHGQGVGYYLEIGPSPVLLAMGQQCVHVEDSEWLPSLRRGADDWKQMLTSLARFHVTGVDVDWGGFERDYGRRKISLPTYPFQRESFWMEKTATTGSAHGMILPSHGREIHPLLGSRIRSPLIDAVVFSSTISTDVLPYLKDHEVFGTIILPATAYLEMALSAARQGGKVEEGIIEKMAIEEPLILNASQPKTLQIIISDSGESAAAFKIYSCEPLSEEGKEDWRLHASGMVRSMETMPDHDAVSEALDAWRRSCDKAIDVDTYYSWLKNIGIIYGPGFNTIERLWQGPGQGLGSLRLSDEMAGQTRDYQLHPALLDGCLQVLGAALLTEDNDGGEGRLYLPIEFGKLTQFGRLGPQCWCHVRIVSGLEEQSETITADLTVLDDRGNRVAIIEGLVAKSADSDALQRISEMRLEKSLYRIDWQAKALPDVRPRETTAPWIVFTDHTGVGGDIVRRLEQAGQSCIVVVPGEHYQVMDDGRITVDPLNPEHFRRMVSERKAAEQSAFGGVLHLWSLDCDDEAAGIDWVKRQQSTLLGSILHLIQALDGGSIATGFRFCLVTRRGQAIGRHAVAAQGLQSAVWGLGRVVSAEHPELGCLRVDLDLGDAGEAAAHVIDEVSRDGQEDQVAYRSGQRLVARFVRLASQSKSNDDSRLSLPPGDSYRLVIRQRGVIDNIALSEASRQAPAPDQVEIRVNATGLNFRDVLNVLDMYPGDPGLLGSECVGRITAVGDGVSGCKVGDRVLAMAAGSFSKYVVTPADLVMPIPANLSDTEAATLPIAFLTACYGLLHLAGMKKGDRVLIHAAAGGVGMAAVQLAKWAGAVVFGTAGSPEKQQFLKTMGVDHVMHSRTLDFAEEIMAVTGGEGVDIVLNALAGEFIPKSLSVLGAGGRFIEIGKAEIWDRARVDQVNPGVDYTAFDLAEVIMKDPKLVKSMFNHIETGFRESRLRALPLHTFSIENAVHAFRFMAQARHTGKIVVTHPVAGEDFASGEAALIHSHAAYLVTGGLGSLGLAVAHWLVGQGARHIVLMGRSLPNRDALAAIDDMRSRGASVVTAQGDVSHRDDLERLFKEIEAGDQPLRGIIHAAGVLDDGVLMQQEWESFDKVLAPKVSGAWLLNDLTRDWPLDFFVMFSSASAVLGSPGQANYAAANAFMDGFSHDLRSKGRNALSINWGPWGETGMADALTDQNKQRVLARGIQPIVPDQGLQTLLLLLKKSLAQATVLPVDWTRFLQSFPKERLPVLFETISAEAGSQPSSAPAENERTALKQRLLEAPESDRAELVLSFVASQAARVMGVDGDKVLDIKKPFNSLGLDSLMAVELRNAIAEAVGESLPASLIYDYSTIEALSGYLLGELTGGEAADTAMEDEAMVDEPDPSVADEIEGLSQEDMAKLLADKIASLNQGHTE